MIPLRVRPATEADLLGLMSIAPTEGLHRSRLAQQERGECCYLVAIDPAHPRIYGHLLLLWNGDAHHRGYPLLADLRVREAFQGQGIGTHLIAQAECLCRARDLPQIGLSVNATENPRAHALYLRLGYRSTEAPPHCNTITLTDEQDRFRLHEDWCVSLVKPLT